MAWSCCENGRSTHTKTSSLLGSRGFQTKTWYTKKKLKRGVVKKDLQRMGLTSEEVEASVQDRPEWRHCVALCIGDVG